MATRRRQTSRPCRNCGRGRGRTTRRGHRRTPDWGWYLIVAVLVMIWIHENPGVIR